MNNFAERIFQSPDDIITGKSVVTEINRRDAFPAQALPPSPWPYGLSDYLQSFIERLVQVRYTPANDRNGAIQGTLVVVGSNFIGIQPKATEDLLIIEISSIRSVNIINYSPGASPKDMR